MGFLKKLADKISKGFIYIVDIDTLEKYLKRELEFSLKNDLEASADLNLYVNAKKHHIQIWNYTASKFESEREKGLIFYYDEEEFRTLEDLMSQKLDNLPDYFKIELILGDDAGLNEYKRSHPELKEENF